MAEWGKRNENYLEGIGMLPTLARLEATNCCRPIFTSFWFFWDFSLLYFCIRRVFGNLMNHSTFDQIESSLEIYRRFNKKWNFQERARDQWEQFESTHNASCLCVPLSCFTYKMQMFGKTKHMHSVLWQLLPTLSILYFPQHYMHFLISWNLII